MTKNSVPKVRTNKLYPIEKTSKKSTNDTKQVFLVVYYVSEEKGLTLVNKTITTSFQLSIAVYSRIVEYIKREEGGKDIIISNIISLGTVRTVKEDEVVL